MYPLLLKPHITDYLWGGTKLKTEYRLETDKDIAAEGWLLSCHKDGSNFEIITAEIVFKYKITKDVYYVC